MTILVILSNDVTNCNAILQTDKKMIPDNVIFLFYINLFNKSQSIFVLLL